MYKNDILNLVSANYGQIKKNKIQIKKIFEEIKNMRKSGDKIIVFGTGVAGKCDVYFMLKKYGIKVDYFCDNNLEKIDKEIVDNIKCIGYEKLLTFKTNCICFIGIGPKYIDEVFLQLTNDKFKYVIRYEVLMIYNLKDVDSKKIPSKKNLLNKINKVLNHIEDQKSIYIFYKIIYWLFIDIKEINNSNIFDYYFEFQYFGKQAEKIKGIKTIVDCGAFTGDSLNYLLTDLNYNNFNEYICYELDNENYNILKNFVENLPVEIKQKINLKNVGVGNQKTVVNYSVAGSGSTEEISGINKGYITKLDYDLNKKNDIFIKMDIEGSEKDALHGASKIIIEKKPKLAIALYHNVYDLWELPIYILELVPQYKLKLENHTKGNVDVVGYFSF